VIEMGGHVERMREMRNVYKMLGNMKGIDHSDDLVVDGRIILEWILEK
jgi:hypothetical protein